MSGVMLGAHSKLTAHARDRARVQRFYRDVLGCAVTVKDEIDIVHFGERFHIGIRYEESALEESTFLNALWLELCCDRPDELKERILSFGIDELEYWDKEHFYFQAPGGQVFRLAGTSEDLSKWQK